MGIVLSKQWEKPLEYFFLGIGFQLNAQQLAAVSMKKASMLGHDDVNVLRGTVDARMIRTLS